MAICIIEPVFRTQIKYQITELPTLRNFHVGGIRFGNLVLDNFSDKLFKKCIIDNQFGTERYLILQSEWLQHYNEKGYCPQQVVFRFVNRTLPVYNVTHYCQFTM